MEDITELEREFGLSKLGFLPQRCIETLADDNPFFALEVIAQNLPTLNKSSTLENEISKLQVFPKGLIKDFDEGDWRRLYVILAMIIHSLIHGSKARWDILDTDSFEVHVNDPGNDLKTCNNKSQHGNIKLHVQLLLPNV